MVVGKGFILPGFFHRVYACEVPLHLVPFECYLLIVVLSGWGLWKWHPRAFMHVVVGACRLNWIWVLVIVMSVFCVLRVGLETVPPFCFCIWHLFFYVDIQKAALFSDNCIL